MSGGKFGLFYAAKTQFGLEEDDWRGLLVRVTGQSSLTKMSGQQLLALTNELRRLGFRQKPGAKLGKTLPPSTKPYIRLIHALWKSCHRKGVIQDGSRKALRAFVRHEMERRGLAPVDDPDFLTSGDATPIIETLKAMEARG